MQIVSGVKRGESEMESLNEGEMIPRVDTRLVISPVVGLCSHLAAVISVSCLILTPWMIWGRHTLLRNQRLELHFHSVALQTYQLCYNLKQNASEDAKRIQRISSVRQRKREMKYIPHFRPRKERMRRRLGCGSSIWRDMTITEHCMLQIRPQN